MTDTATTDTTTTDTTTTDATTTDAQLEEVAQRMASENPSPTLAHLTYVLDLQLFLMTQMPPHWADLPAFKAELEERVGTIRDAVAGYTKAAERFIDATVAMLDDDRVNGPPIEARIAIATKPGENAKHILSRQALEERIAAYQDHRAVIGVAATRL